MDVLEIHPSDAENRGIKEGDLVSLASRAGDITLPARISERMQPGVVYTTFHHAMTGANVVTTEFSDWATNCPEYKVTAVQVQLARHISEWQEHYLETRKQTTRSKRNPPRTTKPWKPTPWSTWRTRLRLFSPAIRRNRPWQVSPTIFRSSGSLACASRSPNTWRTEGRSARPRDRSRKAIALSRVSP